MQEKAMKSGRPPRWRSAGEMAQRINRYFEDCKGHPLTNEITGEPVMDKRGQPVIIGEEPPTVTGLAYALGFDSRQSLLNYQGKAAFSRLIGDAKMRIQAYTEGRLFDRDGVRGAEFSLKNNFGWKEQQDVKVETAAATEAEIMAEVERRLAAETI